MNDKFAVILAGGDLRVLEMGMMYARNASKQGWLNDVKLFLFGPSETQVATDPVPQEMAKTVIGEGLVPIACQYCLDKFLASKLLSGIGCEIGCVGAPISQAIYDGYVPLIW